MRHGANFMVARKALLPVLAAIAIAAMLFVPPIHQDAGYHDFADQRTIFGVPNFWNVVSNLPFLAVALWGWRRSGCAEDRIFLFGVAAVRVGVLPRVAHQRDAVLGSLADDGGVHGVVRDDYRRASG
jgi:hypothetical protein